MIGVHLYRLRGRYIRVKSTVFSGPKHSVVLTYTRCIISLVDLESLEARAVPPTGIVSTSLHTVIGSHALIDI